jgi:hypothetical protein
MESKLAKEKDKPFSCATTFATLVVGLLCEPSMRNLERIAFSMASLILACNFDAHVKTSRFACSLSSMVTPFALLPKKMERQKKLCSKEETHHQRGNCVSEYI